MLVEGLPYILFEFSASKEIIPSLSFFSFVCCFTSVEENHGRRRQARQAGGKRFEHESVCIFSIQSFTRSLCYSKGELAYLTRFSSAGDHFLYSQDPSVCFRTDTVGRN